MRQLVLLRGCQGSGKSTFIKENGLEPYTLSPDVLRTQYSSPVYNTEGKCVISQENDGQVWKILFEMLEERMKKGELIIVDATHSTAKLINKYKQLRVDYRYHTYVVNFDTPLKVCLERNRQRDSYKFVPEEVIENVHERLQHENIPSFTTVIKPHELLETIKWKCIDFDSFRSVKVIGDVHGCYTALNKFMTYEEVADNQDVAYVFVGDLFDRGLENVKVFEFIESIYKLPNVFILEGNHERHLKTYVEVYDEMIKKVEEVENQQEIDNLYYKYFHARGFIKSTLKEFMANDITKDRVKPIIKTLLQCLYFKLNNQKYIITHGGILHNMLDNLNFVSTQQLINGVGSYEFEVDDTWSDYSDTIQIHGHRNLYRNPLKASKSINLEGRVEKGGHLRAITITKGNPFISNQIELHEIKNNVFDPVWLVTNKHTDNLDSEITVEHFLNIAKEFKKDIRVKKQYNDVYSINFTKKMFKSKKWNQIAVHARGLFIKDNGSDSKVVGRAYNKFFNLNETDETKLENLAATLEYPVTAYLKENGYLGIMYYDNDADKLIYASKSTTHLKDANNQYALWFKDIVESTIEPDKLKVLSNTLKENKLSAVFEVIDKVNDPHIVSYKENKVVLLNLIKNELEFNKLDDDVSEKLASKVGVEHKHKDKVFNDWNELYSWYKEINQNTRIEHEGWVLEDNVGFMFKLKTRWYSNWKYLRGFIYKIKNGKAPKQYILQEDAELRQFYYWLKGQDKLYHQRDLVELRERFRKERGSGKQ